MSTDNTGALSDTRGARAVARILVGEPLGDLDSLPERWRELASELTTRPAGVAASERWEQLIAGRPDATALRAAVLAARPGAEEDEPAFDPSARLLPAVEIPELPKAARLDGALRDDCLSAGQWLTKYVEVASAIAPMSPPNFHELLCLTILATAIARRVRLRVSSDSIYPNLYSLLVAPSTLYHKSAAFRFANQTLDQAGLGRMVLPNRITPESLVMELSGRRPSDFDQWEREDKEDWQRERGFASQRAWLMEEAASLLDSFDQKYTAGLLHLVLDLYDCPDKRPGSSTVGRGRQTIRNAYLTICGPTTPAALKPHLNNPLHWANGLWARFILVTPSAPPIWKFWPPEMGIPEALTEPLRVMALEKLPMPKEDGFGVVTEQPTPLTVELAEGVWERWEIYCKALGFDLLAGTAVKEKLTPNYGRFGTISMKVAMLLATIDWSMWGGERQTPLVTLNHWARAQLLSEEWRASLHRLVERPSREGEEEDVETRLIRKLTSAKDGLSARDLSITLNMCKDFEREEIDRTLARMERDGIAFQERRQGKRGRPALIWQMVSEPKGS